jgi:hypothetical protein
MKEDAEGDIFTYEGKSNRRLKFYRVSHYVPNPVFL